MKGMLKNISFKITFLLILLLFSSCSEINNTTNEKIIINETSVKSESTETNEINQEETIVDPEVIQQPEVESENNDTKEETVIESTTCQQPEVKPENNDTKEETVIESTTSQQPEVEPENNDIKEETVIESTTTQQPEVEPENNDTKEETIIESTTSQQPEVEPENNDIKEETVIESTTSQQPEVESENNIIKETENTIEKIEPFDSTFSIHFIDVGQADAALVECDGHYMLIDGGNKGDSNKIYSVLKKANVEFLDIIVATHAHEDHVGGLPGAYNYTTSKITLCPVKSYDSKAFNDFKKYADLNGNGITIPSVGDTFNLGSSTISILAVNSTNDENNSSIILKIKYGETSFLFTGDAEREAEQVLLNSGSDLSSTLLKVGHHGSDTSTTYPFLREIMPKYAIISVGEDNSYGHPEDNILSRLRDADVKVFRTDMQGDIYCSSDGKTITVSVSRNSKIDTLTNPKKVEIKPETPEKDTSTKNEINESNVTSNKIDYILNTNTKKFHYPTCSSVKRMSDKNKGYHTGTREEVISMGYDPCGNCNP